MLDFILKTCMYKIHKHPLFEQNKLDNKVYKIYCKHYSVFLQKSFQVQRRKSCNSIFKTNITHLGRIKYIRITCVITKSKSHQRRLISDSAKPGYKPLNVANYEKGWVVGAKIPTK